MEFEPAGFDSIEDESPIAAAEHFWQTVVVPEQVAGAVFSPSETSVAGGDLQSMTGLSASQLGLQHMAQTNWAHWLKWIAILLAVIVVVAGGGLFIKKSFSGLHTRTITNGGFSYTFKFFKPANEVQLGDGSNALKNGNNVVAGAMPTTDAVPSSCSQIGSQWSEAFSVSIQGQKLPVCSTGSDFALIFSALGQRHLFTLTYRQTSTAANLQDTKTIFNSIRVSR